jgi:hypothetical protein
MNLGDFRLGETFDFKFTTRRFSTGAPYTLAGSPVISAYHGNDTTQITAGITLSVDFDSVTGLNNVRVVASGGNGYATATNYSLVITTGTVDSVSVVGEVVGTFSIENRSAIMPTTAGRTLDVSAGGEAGVDWANVGSPTTTVGLSGTTVKTATDVATALDAVDNFIDTEIGAIISTLGTPAGASISADIAAIEAQTDDIGTAGAGLTAVPWNAAWDAEVQSEVADALADVGVTTTVTGRIDAAISTRATPAQVNAEVLDCLVTDTHAEVSGVPAATSSLKDKLNWLFALARNKLKQNTTTQTLYADDGSTTVSTATVSDSGTEATRGEWS